MSRQVIPEAAVEAAAKAEWARCGSYDPTATWETEEPNYREYLRDAMRAALEAAAPHMLAGEAIDRDEIGYLCSRGHFVFHGDPDGDSCGSKRTAGVYVERDPVVEFYGPYEVADDDGFVYASGCGYSEEDYAEELTHARQSLTEQIETWRKS